MYHDCPLRFGLERARALLLTFILPSLVPFPVSRSGPYRRFLLGINIAWASRPTTVVSFTSSFPNFAVLLLIYSLLPMTLLAVFSTNFSNPSKIFAPARSLSVSVSTVTRLSNSSDNFVSFREYLLGVLAVSLLFVVHLFSKCTTSYRTHLFKLSCGSNVYIRQRSMVPTSST